MVHRESHIGSEEWQDRGCQLIQLAVTAACSYATGLHRPASISAVDQLYKSLSSDLLHELWQLDPAAPKRKKGPSWGLHVNDPADPEEFAANHLLGGAKDISFNDMLRHITSRAVAAVEHSTEIGYGQRSASTLISRLRDLHGLQPAVSKAQHGAMADRASFNRPHSQAKKRRN